MSSEGEASDEEEDACTVYECPGLAPVCTAASYHLSVCLSVCLSLCLSACLSCNKYKVKYEPVCQVTNYNVLMPLVTVLSFHSCLTFVLIHNRHGIKLPKLTRSALNVAAFPFCNDVRICLSLTADVSRQLLTTSIYSCM